MLNGYVAEQGAVVKLRGERLLVSLSGALIDELRIGELGTLVIIGNVTLTTPAIAALLENQVPVAFLSLGGQFRGRLEPPLSTSVAVRRAQFLALEDADFALALARQSVAAKLLNCRALLLRSRRRRQLPEAGAAPTVLRTSAELASHARSVEEVRGIEGRASAAYFEAFGALLADPWEFNGRSRRPPRDEPNALLSLGYTLLLTRVMAGVQIAGLNAGAGFLHTSHHGSPALALDLMEEFRSTIVDQVVLQALNGGIVAPEHFETTEKLPHALTRAGFERFVGEFERRLQEGFTPKGRSTPTSYGDFIWSQALALRRAFENHDPDEYQPHVRR
ncbi:MAG: CRISPR-associated endonuclease Cas1 [Armatimonadota bacterium]|nr:CRISPR-associated endonuclease Cas1 [Armatimonadota bacterium]